MVIVDNDRLNGEWKVGNLSGPGVAIKTEKVKKGEK